MPRDLSEREADALAAMMGADARRIDDLVGDVGAIKGDVRTLTAESHRIGTGVEQLQQSMAVLSRHAVLMETQSAELVALRLKGEGLDGRLRAVEAEIPPLKEARGWAVRGVLLVLGIVGAAVLALVVNSR